LSLSLGKPADNKKIGGGSATHRQDKGFTLMIVLYSFDHVFTIYIEGLDPRLPYKYFSENRNYFLGVLKEDA